jgi:enoyl-CoA hydratase/carnithine racemase
MSATKTKTKTTPDSAATAYKNILVARDGQITTITMNTPEKRNALSLEMMNELIAAFTAVGNDKDTRVVVLAANGPAFSAGHDLRDLVDGDVTIYRHVFDVCVQLMELIQAIPQPVIARVHRIATAAGCQLVASCDMAVASDDARFATSGIDNGLFCSTPMVALSRNVSRKQAMEMLMTGEPISAQRAVDIGLINHVVPAGHERDAAIALAQKIACKSALAIKLGKQAFYRQAEMNLADAYRFTAEVMTENMMAFDGKEGIGAFLEKREPKWQDE